MPALLALAVATGSTIALAGCAAAGSSPTPSTPTVTVTATMTATVTATPTPTPVRSSVPGTQPELSSPVDDSSADVETANADDDLFGATSETDAQAQVDPWASTTPHGSLSLLGPEGGNYGQGWASGNCANWHLGFVNGSNLPITSITFAPPGGGYSSTGTGLPVIPADPPAPAVLDVYLQPGETGSIRFKTCTSTAPPAEPSYEYNATSPRTVSFAWITGQEQTVCWSWYC